MKGSKLKYTNFIILAFLLVISCDIRKNPDKLNRICLEKIEKGEHMNAQKFCEEACRRGVKSACMKQAYILDTYVKDGVDKAISIYSQLCTDGEAEACYSLGNIYAKGRAKVLDSDKKAKEFFSKACKMGIEIACEQIQQMEVSSQRTQQLKISEAEENRIREMVVEYHNAVAEERIEDALDFYTSYRRPQIKVNLLETIAKDTEYYVVEEVDVLEVFGNTAQVYVRVRQKMTYSPKEQVWEGVWTVEKENGEWKIVRTPGRRIQ